MNREIKFRAWNPQTKQMEYDVGVDFLGRPTSFIDGDLFIDAEKMIVQQYTGLKDKNGKEIYEGDIVEENGINRVVEYGYCEVDNEGSTGDYAYGFNLYHDNRGVEVIGSIYETPTLINKQ